MKKIKLLLAAMAAMVGLGANAQTDWTGVSEITSGKAYYIVNDATGLFIAPGNNWGTRATLDESPAAPATVTLADGKYTIIFTNPAGGNGLFVDADDGSALFCDRNNQGNYFWTITYNGDNTFNVKLASDQARYSEGSFLTAENGNVWANVQYNSSNESYRKWRFISVEDVKTTMLASEEKLDVSLLVHGAQGPNNIGASNNSWDRYKERYSWTTSGNNWKGQNNQTLAGFNKYWIECWSGGALTNRSISKTVNDLPAGHYIISAYTIGGSGVEWFAQIGNGDKVTAATTGTPPTETSVELDLTETGNITLGIQSNSTTNVQWIAFDNVKMEYTSFKKNYTEKLNAANELATSLSGNIPTAALTALNSTISTYTGVTSDFMAAADALNTAMETANSLVANYSRYKSVRTAVLDINGEINVSDANTAVEAATDNDGIDAAVGTLRAAFTTYLAGANITDDQIDITAVLIDNASPGISGTTDYWENSGNPSLDHQLYEYWNASGATTKQTIATELPAGYYTLTAVAYTRDNMTATLHAGTNNTINLVGCGSVNDRNEGNNWIAQGNGNGVNELTFNLTDATSNLEIGLTADSSTGDHWMCWRSFKLEYLGTNPVSLMRDRYNDALAEAETARDNTEYANVTGSERTDLQAAIAATPSTVAEYEAAIEDLNDAVAAFIAAKTNYDALVREIAKANALGFDGSMYAATSSTTAAIALTNTQSLKVNEYTYVTNQYPYSVALSDTWNSTGTNTEDATFSNEHWSGETHEYKNQKDSENPAQGWHANSWSLDFNQNVTLPAGSYVFKVAGRRASGNATTMSLVVKQGDTVLGTVSDFPEGNSGLGINTSGETDFTTGEGHTYAKDGNGFGWEWRYVKFELNNLATVNIGIHAEATAQYQWISFGDYTLQADNADVAELLAALAEYDAALAAANAAKDNDEYENVQGIELTYLQEAINTDATLDKSSLSAVQTATNALKVNTASFIEAKDSYNRFAQAKAEEALTKITENVGDGVFQYNATTNDNCWNEYEYNKNMVDNYDVSQGTASQVLGFANDLYSSIEAYKNQTLNAPAVGSKYYIKVATTEHAKLGNAWLLNAGSTSNNNPTGYTIQANKAPAAYLSTQAWTLTQVSGNSYKISLDLNGTTVYLTNGTANNSAAGWKASQIQGTTDSDKAMAFKIAAADVDNTFYIYNTETNSTIACQPGGNIYTEADNAYFTVEEVTQVSVEVSVAAGKLATRIFPFTPTLPEGVAAYSCAGNTGTSLTLVEVAEPAANVPYILYSENGCASTDLTGWGTATTDSYTEDYLTGVYTRTEVPEGSYVLQTQSGTQAFYKVSQAGAYSSAYRVYVTVPAAGVKAFSFTLDDMQTAIEAARAEGESTVTLRYNAAGQQMQNAQKGLNIIKMEDGSIRKVLVK